MIVETINMKKIDIYSVYVEAYRYERHVAYLVIGKIRLSFGRMDTEVIAVFSDVDKALDYKDELKHRLEDELDIPFAPVPGELEEAAYD